VSRDLPEFPPAPAVDRPLAPGLLPRLSAWALRRAGWTVRIPLPVPERCVAIFYPHTTNWDTVIGLVAKPMTGLAINFVGKHTLFRGPLRSVLGRWGGIPIDRRAPGDFVERITAEFHKRDVFRLALAPEGTRSRTENWKSGFYRIARAAQVPIALVYIDYPSREIGVGGYLDLTGDVAADMARIRAFYAGKRGLRPDRQGPVRLHEESGGQG
jgi:1-acyl-sn-glycerol-3-phosphate acyltransferase